MTIVPRTPRQADRNRASTPSEPVHKTRSPDAATAPKRVEQLIGNLETQRLVQASLRVGNPSDAQEQEADRVADAASSSCSNDVGLSAPSAAPKIRRNAKNASQRELSLPEARLGRLGSGSPLDTALRTRMQQRLGHDFSPVRVHTGATAAQVSRTIDARAFTAGSDVVFDEGEFRPGTRDGDRLLAHELAHVIQNGGENKTIRRRVNGDIRQLNITEAFARELTDEELPQQMEILRTEMATHPPDSAEYRSAQQNTEVLNTESRRRHPNQAMAGQIVPRPPGLPLQGGYQLMPIELPPDVAGQIPEGQIVSVDSAAAGVGLGSYVGNRPSTGAASLAGGAWAGLRTNLSTYGFAAAGENAIGVVAFPRYLPGRALSGMSSLIPEHPVIWGHTAVYVRQGGRIVAVRSYAPASLLEAARTPGVVTGTAEVPAAIYSETGAFDIFNVSNARSVEWAAAPDEVAAMLNSLPEGGTYGIGRPIAGGAQYTAVPGASQACTGTNCVGWAFEQVGPQRTGSLPQDLNQGRLIRALRNAESGEGVAVGGLTRGMQVLKWGGRVMLVVGIVMIPVEVAMARPEDRARTAVGATSGFLGGLALGATAGLVCGPGAPVCSVVLGIGFGIVGAFGARAIAEGIYDSATAPSSDQAYRPPCPGQGRCHDANPPRPMLDLSARFGLLPPRQNALNPADIEIIRRWLATDPSLSRTPR